MKGKSKKSTYSTTFGVDPKILTEKVAPNGESGIPGKDYLVHLLIK